MEKQEEKFNLWETYFRVLKYSIRQKKMFFGAMFFTFLGVGFKLLIPVVFSLFFNYAQRSLTGETIGLSNEILWLSVLFFAIHFADGITNAFGDYTIVKWWLTSENRIFKEAYRHITHLSVEFYEKNPTGKIRERVWDGSQAIVNILEYTFLDIFPQLIFIIAAIVILLFIKPIFGLVILFIVPLYFVVSYYYFRKLNVIQKENREKWEDLSTFVNESVYNSKTIKTYSTESYHINKIERLSNNAIGCEIKWEFLHSLSRANRSIVLNLVRVFTIGFGFYLIIEGNISLGTFVLIWNYSTQSLDPINHMAKSVDKIQKLLVGTALTFKYLDEIPTVQDKEKPKSLKVKKGDIQFNNIDFQYKDRRVIKDFSFQVPAGKKVAIVGKSGSGKSTLVKLLLRFYDPQKGSILIDGKDIKDVTQHSLRNNIAVVMQDSVLFNDTVLNNIAYSKAGAKKAEVIKAAKVAYADDFISKLSKGYETIVGEKGVKLSGGEQQRINIARAVLRNAPILVFDEATSSLDSESEIMIHAAMSKLMEGKTSIIIAHRLSTVMSADIILVMDKGKIAEVGTHDDLVSKKGGIYSKLFEIKSGGYLV